MRVPLTLACGEYDRTYPLASGAIRPEGADLTFLALPVEETFFRMTRHREFDTGELSLSSYLISLDQGAPWAYADAERTRALMGGEFWTSGLEGNEDGLRTFVRYAFEQGLIKQGLIKEPRSPASLFAAETREAFVI